MGLGPENYETTSFQHSHFRACSIFFAHPCFHGIFPSSGRQLIFFTFSSRHGEHLELLGEVLEIHDLSDQPLSWLVVWLPSISYFSIHWEFRIIQMTNWRSLFFRRVAQPPAIWESGHCFQWGMSCRDPHKSVTKSKTISTWSIYDLTWSGWWFGCHQFYFPILIGFLIIPIDELIFFRGVARNHQPVVCDLGFPAFDTHPLNAHFFEARIGQGSYMPKSCEKITNRYLLKTGTLKRPTSSLVVWCYFVLGFVCHCQPFFF